MRSRAARSSGEFKRSSHLLRTHVIDGLDFTRLFGDYGLRPLTTVNVTRREHFSYPTVHQLTQGHCGSDFTKKCEFTKYTLSLSL